MLVQPAVSCTDSF